MSDNFSQGPWSDSPNAPQIPYSLYQAEKYNFAGIILTSTFYGIATVLFFQCISALLNPLNRTKGRINWGLVVHTTTMFSFATIFTGMTLDIQSISFIDKREFTGSIVLPPGPLGYQVLIYSEALGIVPSVVFLINQWLGDGLLLYRCYVIYAMNRWVIAFPCLMYITTWGMGMVFLYQTSQPGSIQGSLAASTGIPFYAISISLNGLLTLMIVVRLILHRKNIRTAMGSAKGTGGLYKAIITMMIESSALYTVNSLLFIGPWSDGSWLADIFLPILAETQVIAPFLIILRVANRRALTSETIVSGNIGSLHFGSNEGATGSSETLPDESPVSFVDATGRAPDELEVGTAIDDEVL